MQDTITHADPNPKQSKEFGWTAPDAFQGGSVDFTLANFNEF